MIKYFLASWHDTLSRMTARPVKIYYEVRKKEKERKKKEN